LGRSLWADTVPKAIWTLGTSQHYDPRFRAYNGMTGCKAPGVGGRAPNDRGGPEMKPLTNAFAAAVVLAGVLGVSTGRTQPVEGGPDPSTILGQTQIQNEQYQQQAQQQIQQNQQQDRMDQQQQQQGQQPYQNYQGQQNTGAFHSGDPHCFERLVGLPVFAPIAHKVDLAPPNLQPKPLLQITAKPTAAEGQLLMKWLNARQSCVKANVSTWDESSPAQYSMYQKVTGIVDGMIPKLAAGQLTYGEFNSKRAALTNMMDAYMETH
jgi:hypothetical protein